MRLVTLGALRLACQRRADMEEDDEDDAVIVPAEWNALASAQYGEMYMAVADVGSRHFEDTETITATGAASYALPTDHLATLGIDHVRSNGERRSLVPLSVQERNRYANQRGDATGYSTVGQNIVFGPKPSNGTYELLYVPQPPDLTLLNDTDTVDMVTIDGQEFVIWGVVVKALAKTEGDARLAISEREQARKRLVEWAVQRELIAQRRRHVRENHDFGDIHGSWNPASPRNTPP